MIRDAVAAATAKLRPAPSVATPSRPRELAAGLGCDQAERNGLVRTRHRGAIAPSIAALSPSMTTSTSSSDIAALRNAASN